MIVAATPQPGFNFNNVQFGVPNAASPQALATAGKVAAQALSSFSLGRFNSDLNFGGFVFSASSESVSILLRALQESRRLEVLSRPQIMALDNQQGFVTVGQSVPIIVDVNQNQFGQIRSAVQYRDVGIILTVRPRISPDGLVVMFVDANKSELGSELEGVPISISPNGQVVRQPIIDQTRATTTIAAYDGQTVVLSGLLSKNQFDVHRRVPLLADIPLLGDLFRYDAVAVQRSELLIILTPKVMRSRLDMDMLKQEESARMSWCLADVVDLQGNVGMRSRFDEWQDSETEAIYPDYVPQEGELYLPEGQAPPEPSLEMLPPQANSAVQQQQHPTTGGPPVSPPPVAEVARLPAVGERGSTVR